MFINLTKAEVEETVTALEDFQAYAADCTRNDLKFVQSAKKTTDECTFYTEREGGKR